MKPPNLKAILSVFWFSVALLLIGLPNFVGVIAHPNRAEAAMHLVIAVSLILLPAALGASLRKTFLCWLPLMVFCPAAALYHLLTGYPVNAWTLLVLTETNSEELSSFAFHCALIVIATPLLAWAAWDVVTRRLASEMRIPGSLRMVIVATVMILPAVDISIAGFSHGWKPSVDRLGKIFPAGLVVHAVKLAELRGSKVDRGGLAATIQASQRDRPAGREIHLLVIGETCRYANWSMHGYHRDTAPRLSATPGLVDFTDVASGAASTAVSVPMILTGAEPGEHSSALSRPSIATYFRAAGFKVYWLSVPNKHGLGDTVCSRFAEDADEARFLSGLVDATGFGSFRTAYDSAVVPEVRRIISRGEPRVLIICHTMGSHSNYADRYPPEFAKYPVPPGECPIARLKPVLTARDKEILQNAYDNSIAYTDTVLAELIQVLASASDAASSFCFVPDHGENGGETSVLPFAHGTNTADVLHVPMFMWVSGEYRKRFPEKAALLRQRHDAPASSFHVLHTIADLAGLEFSGFRADRSVASPAYRLSTRKVLSPNGAVVQHYEELMEAEQKRGGWRPLNPRSSGAVVAGP